MRALGSIARLQDSRRIFLLASLFILGAWLRYLFAVEFHPPEAHVTTDMGGFLSGARQMAAGHIDDWVKHRSPLYGLLIALSLKLSGLGLTIGPFDFITYFQIAASLALPFIIARITAIYLGPRFGDVAFAIAMLHFPFIGFTGLFMAEISCALLVTLLAFLMLRFRFPWPAARGFACGALWGFGAICKGITMLFPVLAFTWWLLETRKRSANLGVAFKNTARAWAPFAVGGALMLGAQAAYFYSAGSHEILSPTATGIGFAVSRCTSCGKFLDSEGAWFCSPVVATTVGCAPECTFAEPFRNSAYYWKRGFDCMLSDPLSLLRIFREPKNLFVGSPMFPFGEGTEPYRALNQWYQAIFDLFLLPGLAFAALKAIGRRRVSRRSTLLRLLVLTLLASTLLFGGEPRYRVPFDGLFIPFGLAGWRLAVTKCFGRSGRPRDFFPALLLPLWLLATLPWYLERFLFEQRALSAAYYYPVLVAMPVLGLALLALHFAFELRPAAPAEK